MLCGDDLDLLIIFLLAVGLSMDAFAVSVTNGMCYKLPLVKNALYSGLAFGLFQGLMPLVGYYAGHSFAQVVERYVHWIALILLCFIGIKTIIGAVKEARNPEKVSERIFSFKTLGVQAVATSIDAMAVGVSLGFMNVRLWLSVSMIAVITFVVSFSGVIIGRKFGQLFKEKAEILGGLILIIIGLRIFLTA